MSEPIPSFTLATWNVNSLRSRGGHVLDFLRRREPDVLGLQELKMPEDEFPGDEFLDAGYYAEVLGQRAYNGVALLSREPLTEPIRGLAQLPDDLEARLVSGRFAGVRLINVYVPNGESVGSAKFRYKLSWLDALARHLEAEHDPREPLAIFGDFNIAPDDRDVFDPAAFRGQVLFSDEEHAAFRRLCDWGLVDLYRALHPEGRAYSWWDYRQMAFRRGLGARIDLVLVTRPLVERAASCEVDEGPRKLERPSDHAPVLARFE